MSNSQTFTFIQHNLSCVEYYESLGKSAKVISSKDTFRDINTYLQKNKADLYTLQNVENKTNSNNGVVPSQSKTFKFEYNNIKKETYYIGDSDETVNIKNGCAVVYDSNIFNLVESYDLNFYFPVLCDFASPLVHLEVNKSKEYLFVLSVDSIKPYPITLQRSNKIKKIVDSLIKMLETFNRIFTKEQIEFSFIIGGDFKMNLYEPNLDDFKSSSVKKKEAKKIIDDSIKKLFNTFEKLDIEYDLDDSIDTVYTGDDQNNYHNCNDFIFKSKYLETEKIQYGCNHQGSLPEWQDLNEFNTDFQHKSITCMFSSN